MTWINHLPREADALESNRRDRQARLGTRRSKFLAGPGTANLPLHQNFQKKEDSKIESSFSTLSINRARINSEIFLEVLLCLTLDR